MRGIFYRSDTRDPDSGADLFTNGFDKRDANFAAPQLRDLSGVGPLIAPDVDPHSAVCFTRDFLAAPIFPVSDLNCPSWVYVLDLDVDDVLNTQATQFNLMQASGRNTGGNGAGALWPMFGQERCCDAIANTDIVGALRVSRAFLGGFAQGGSFVCSVYRANPNYAGGQAASVRAVMESYIDGSSHNTPTQAQGLVQSTQT